MARARTAFSLARAISDDPARARELAVTARKAVPKEHRTLCEQIDAWLREHPAVP